MKKVILFIVPFFLMAAAETATVTKARADINPAQGQKVKGIVTFEKVTGGVRVVADIEGLTPGKHGFHIHEKGECTQPDFVSAGAHFNPDNQPHGGPDSEKHHVGDLGNLKAGPDGKAHYDRIDSVITLEGDHSVLNRSVIVHADPDDYVSQPAGNAGARIGCGIILPVND